MIPSNINAVFEHVSLMSFFRVLCFNVVEIFFSVYILFKFHDCVPHFLDLEMHPDGLSIYRKETHTAQFVHYDSFIKWNHKVAWIRSLTSRANRLCSANKLKDELANIKRFASYNGFPRWIANKLIKESTSPQRRPKDDGDTHDICMFLPYTG